MDLALAARSRLRRPGARCARLGTRASSAGSRASCGARRPSARSSRRPTTPSTGPTQRGRFTYVNPGDAAPARPLGREQDSSGRPYLDFIRPDYREQAAAFYNDQYAQRIPNTYCEFPILTAAGETWLGQSVLLVIDRGARRRLPRRRSGHHRAAPCRRGCRARAWRGSAWWWSTHPWPWRCSITMAATSLTRQSGSATWACPVPSSVGSSPRSLPSSPIVTPTRWRESSRGRA